MPDVFFTVDPDGLEALRSQLEHIQNGMQDAGNVVDSYSPLDFGPDDAVWNALQTFQVAWSSGLAKIRQNLSALVGKEVSAGFAFKEGNWWAWFADEWIGYFPGEEPLSEPETAALAALIDRAGIAGIVAVHAPFACVNYDGPAVAWAERVAAACGWPARGDIGYPTPGSLGSWFGIDRGLPILTVELPPGPLDAFRDRCRAALDEALTMNPIRIR